MSPSPLNIKSGVCSHSSPDMWQEFVIFAIDPCEHGHYTNEYFEDWCKCLELPVTRLQGCYDGEEETSFIMTAQDFFTARPERNDLSVGGIWCKEQESVLHLSKPEKRSRMWRSAFLLMSDKADSDEKVKHLGYFKQVRKADAVSRDAWTHNPNNGGWFICEQSQQEYL